ncbi:MAG TPA: alkaline phosphatase family protein [Solirubrobacteraceae bacterium]|jgi:hypothetical protein|nr:alkaline phosphatase family protein [Solirubrobacteraceae bacterium]
MRLVALSSAAATGLVVWAGLAGESSNGNLAAAFAHRQSLLASAAATHAPAQQPPASDGGGTSEAGGGGESSSEARNSGEAQSSPSSSAAASSTAGAETSPAGPAAPAATASPGASAPTRGVSGTRRGPRSKIKHVFIITLQSPGYAATWGAGSAARYLNTQLRPRGELLSNYYAVAHPDLPNYIAMTSGQPPNADTAGNCPTFAQFPAGIKPDAAGRLEAPGCVYPLNVLTVADQLTSSGRQWRAYVEDLANGPKPVQSCRHPNSGQPDETQRERPGDGYATRHNPFVYFDSLLDLGDCTSDDLPLTSLPAALASTASTPNYAFIAPNLCHDGSEVVCADGAPGGLAAADGFLAEWVPKILASPAYRRDGLLVITFGDGPPSDTTGCCESPAHAAAPTAGGGRVGALLLSPFATAGAESARPYNHYSLLRTVEDIFALAHLANAGQAGVSSFATDALSKALPAHR